MNMNFTMVLVELICVENLNNDILHSARLGMGSSSLTHWGLVAPYGSVQNSTKKVVSPAALNLKS